MENMLLKAAKEGNEFAFAQIVETYEKRIYRLCYRMTGHAEDAADQTQETFLKAWRGLPSFQGDCSIGTWLHRLAVNCCIDYWRKEKKHRTHAAAEESQTDAAVQNDVPDTGPGPYEQLLQRERQEAVRRAMARLSPEHQAVLALREAGGLSYEEIASVLRIEEGTVKSRIARARVQLRNLLLSDGTFLA